MELRSQKSVLPYGTSMTLTHVRSMKSQRPRSVSQSSRLRSVLTTGLTEARLTPDH